MLLTEHLVQGVDVWLNTPRRPWEASGTSGMKVLINGGLNLSVLDGWWAEAYAPQVGWALGDGHEHGDDPAWDAADAEALYDLLEHEVIPEFYDRDERGIPVAWIKRMRESMASLTPHYSTNRAVREYTEQYYIPAATRYRERVADNGKIGADLIDWQHTLDKKWAALRFGEVTHTTNDKQHIFDAQVYLDALDPKSVKIELYADGIDGDTAEVVTMQHEEPLPDQANATLYRASVPAVRPATDYTVRLIPHRDGVMAPLEEMRILWQR